MWARALPSGLSKSAPEKGTYLPKSPLAHGRGGVPNPEVPKAAHAYVRDSRGRGMGRRPSLFSAPKAPNQRRVGYETGPVWMADGPFLQKLEFQSRVVRLRKMMPSSIAKVLRQITVLPAAFRSPSLQHPLLCHKLPLLGLFKGPLLARTADKVYWTLAENSRGEPDAVQFV